MPKLGTDPFTPPGSGAFAFRISRGECASLERSLNLKNTRQERRNLRRGKLVDTFKRNVGSSFFKSSFAGNNVMTSTPRTLARNSNSQSGTRRKKTGHRASNARWWLHHQDSSGCRECSVRPKLGAFAGIGRRCPQGSEQLRASGPVSTGASFARRQSAASVAFRVAVVAAIRIQLPSPRRLGAAV